MESLRRTAFLFLIGGFGYFLLEVLYRGYSHWTMFLTGGVAFVCLFFLFNLSMPFSFFTRCFLGAVVITSLEFTVGIIVNKFLSWNVWDYSPLPFNVLGQISFAYSIIWFVLCIPIGLFSRFLAARL